MVKLSGAKADQWIAKPGRNQHAVLLYGPNLGLVRERAKTMLRTWAGDAHDDPFAVATVDDARVRAEPSVIADEAFQQSFLGGAKVVWVTEAGDKLAGPLGEVLASDVEPNPIVVEAGDLPPRSKLRQLFEKADNAAAIGCYDDDGRSISALIETRFREWGIRADRKAVEALAQRLGRDRMANLSEIEKVCLYAGEGGELDETGIRLAVGDGAQSTLDDIVYAVFDGRRDVADRMLASGFDEGVMPVQFVRRLQGHLERLLLVRSMIDGGASPDQAVGKLRPPVFFMYKDRFRRQASMWPAEQLRKCLDALTTLEIECKTTGMPDTALCQRMSLSIGGLAQRLGR